MEELTDRQRAILQFITEHILAERFPPTIREIGVAMGIRSTNGVNDHLKALERKGYLSRGEMKSRAIFPTNEGWGIFGLADPSDGGSGDSPRLRSIEGGKKGPTSAAASSKAALRAVASAEDGSLEVPVLGRVAAGAPILAEESFDSSVRVDPSLLGRGSKEGIFALRVKGDSMIDDGIFEGDLLFVRKQQTANRGEIVVAMIEGEATVKRYFPEGDRVRLQPSNERLSPIYLRRSDARAAALLGVVVGVFRQIG